MKTMVIKLTPEQHLLLKEALDRVLDEDFENLPLRELWHACARAEAVETPEVAATPAYVGFEVSMLAAAIRSQVAAD